MEHAQREKRCTVLHLYLLIVLILILMEHAQRAMEEADVDTISISVLILILMEHAQRDHFNGRI